MLMSLNKVAFTYQLPGYDQVPERTSVQYYKLRSYDTFQVAANIIRERIDEKDPNPSSVDSILLDITLGFYAVPGKGRRRGFHIPGIRPMEREKVNGNGSWNFLPLSIFPLHRCGEPMEPFVSGNYPSWGLNTYLYEECDNKREKLYKRLPELILYVRRAAELRARFMLHEGYA